MTAEHDEHPDHDDEIVIACSMFLLCANPAECDLGHVPACTRCTHKLGFPLILGRFTIDAAGPVVTFTATNAEEITGV